MAESVIGRGIIELIADGRKMKAGIEDAKRATRTLGEGQKEISKAAQRSIDQYIGRLQVQNATLGKSVRETELYKLALRGASNEQLNAANAALRLRERHEQIATISTQATAALRTFALVAVTGLIAAAAAFDTFLKQAGKFQDLSEKMGDTAEAVASLSVSAAVGGVSMDTIAAASARLTKGLAGLDEESKGTATALRALGLNVEAFKNLPAADRLEAIAKALAKFQDGTEKTAVAVALFGRSGADLLPFLKELGQEGGRQAILTAEQIRQADEYADRQAKLRAEISLHAQAIAVQMLPAYADLTGAFRDVIKGIAGVQDGAQGLRKDTSIQDFAESAVKVMAFAVDQIDAFARSFEIVGKRIAAVAATARAIQQGNLREAISIEIESIRDINRILNRPSFGEALDARIAARKLTESLSAQNQRELNRTGVSPEKTKLDFQDPADQIKLIQQISKERQSAIEKGIAAESAATQTRVASISDIAASERAIERAQLDSIAKRVAAATAAYEIERAIIKARGDSAQKSNEEQRASGTRLYDNLIARNNEYLNIYRTNQAKIVTLDKEVTDNAKRAADLIKNARTAQLPPEQQVEQLFQDTREQDQRAVSALLTGDLVTLRSIREEAEKTAQALISAGKIDDAERHLQRINDLFKTGSDEQTLKIKRIADEAAKGAQGTEKQIKDLQAQLEKMRDTALGDFKISASDESLKGLVTSIRETIAKEQFPINLQPQIGAGALPFNPPGLAGGGTVPGFSPSPRSDNILARLTAGEYVVPVPAVRHYGSDFMDAIRSMALPKFADGGGVAGSSSGGDGLMVHDIRINGRPVARVMGARDQVQSLVDAISEIAR